MKFGNAADFLKLTPDEQAYVEMKLALARTLEETRKHKGLTQKTLAVKVAYHSAPGSHDGKGIRLFPLICSSVPCCSWASLPETGCSDMIGEAG